MKAIYHTINKANTHPECCWCEEMETRNHHGT